MTPDDIADWLLTNLDGAVEKHAYGERQFFYNPGLVAPMGAYVATLKLQDGPNDKASRLDRVDVYRLCFAMKPADYEQAFGPRPARPAKGGIIEGSYDFIALDHLTPHPVYGWMGWAQVLCPGAETFETCKPLLGKAHAKAVAGFSKRKSA